MRIAPAYNKGALQYLPKGVDRDEWPNREDHPSDAREPPKPRRVERDPGAVQPLEVLMKIPLSGLINVRSPLRSFGKGV